MTEQYEILDNLLIINLPETLNSTNATLVEAKILQHISRGMNRLLIDLSRLNSIAGAGLRVVLVAAKRLKQSAGTLVLCGIQKPLCEIFEISGLLNILSVVDTRECALQRFSQASCRPLHVLTNRPRENAETPQSILDSRGVGAQRQAWGAI